MSKNHSEEFRHVVEQLGDPDRIEQELGQRRRDHAYFDNNRERLTRMHPNRYVAILGERVVGYDKNLLSLVKRLQERGKQDAYIERTYFAENRPTFILAAVA